MKSNKISKISSLLYLILFYLYKLQHEDDHNEYKHKQNVHLRVIVTLYIQCNEWSYVDNIEQFKECTCYLLISSCLVP